MRIRLDEQLAQLGASLLEMSAMVKKAISNATQALLDQDVDEAKRIMVADDEIDLMEKEIERLCLQVILQQQPVARDLRFVSAILKIMTDLERIGDHASDISEFTQYLAGKPYIKKMDHIPVMADLTMAMVTESIEAFVNKDLKLAKKVISKDDDVDELFMLIKNELIELINEDASNGDQALDLMMVTKYYERIGDHATNIAEWAVFSLTGKHKNSQIM